MFSNLALCCSNFDFCENDFSKIGLDLLVESPILKFLKGAYTGIVDFVIGIIFAYQDATVMDFHIVEAIAFFDLPIRVHVRAIVVIKSAPIHDCLVMQACKLGRKCGIGD